MGSAVRSLLHVVRDTDGSDAAHPRARYLSTTAQGVSSRPPSRGEIALVFSGMRDSRLQQGDRSCSIEAMAIRGSLTPSLVQRMLKGEIRIGLDDAIAFGSIGVEILEWALAAAKSRMIGGAR